MPDLTQLPPSTTNKSVRGRYAPSPSGDLHLGNLRTALLAWLFTRAFNGRFVLRVEDLDQPRMRLSATKTILDDLHWLGLDWDEGPDCGGPFSPYTQSERIPLYEQALQRLRDEGLIYPCYCSRADVALAASAPQQRRENTARYPGTCRTLTRSQIQQFEAQGRRPSLRFHVDDERTIHFTDLLCGPHSQQVQQSVGDFIVRRADGIFAYQFAVVVDDGLMQINQVVRGADLLSSTPRQILLFEALHFPIPIFAHMPLLLDTSGHRLAKRHKSAGLDPLRLAGQSPGQVLSQLASSCGLIESDDSVRLEDLRARYSADEYGIMHAIQHLSQKISSRRLVL